MEERKEESQAGSGLNRRRFIGALGAAAVAGAILNREGTAQNPPPPVVNYQDSFGNIVPAAADLVAANIYPPPIPSSQQPPNGPQEVHRGGRVHPEGEHGPPRLRRG